MIARHIAFFLYGCLLVLLPTQLGYHSWPSWAIVLGRRIDYLSPTLYLTDVLIVCLIFFVLWDVELRKRYAMIFQAFARHYFFVVFCLFVVGINIGVSMEPLRTLYAWIKVLEYALCVCAIVALRPSPTRTVLGIACAMTWSGLLAIGQYYHEGSLGGLFWFLGERSFSLDTPGIARSSVEMLRPYASFPHPNVLGGFLAIGMVLIFFGHQKSHRVWCFIVAGIALVALYLSQSRSAWASLGGMMIAYSVLRGHTRGQKIRGLFFLFCFFIGAIIVILRIPIGDESVRVRTELFYAAGKIFMTSPFVGVGLGNFLLHLPGVLVSRGVYFLQPVHSIFMLVLAEIGILGSVCVLWCVWHIRTIIQNNYLFLSGVLGLLLIGTIDHYPLTLQQGQLLLSVLLANAMITRYDN